MLIIALRLAEYRFLVLEHSVEISSALVASLFAGLGIWLGPYGAEQCSPALIERSTSGLRVTATMMCGTPLGNIMNDPAWSG